MPEKYDLTAAAPPTPDFVIEPVTPEAAARPVGLGGKLLCGGLAGLIVIGVASRMNHDYAEAEAAGATQIILAEAEAEMKPAPQVEVMRGASAFASSKQDWVFDN